MPWFSASRINTFSKQIPSNWILPWRVEKCSSQTSPEKARPWTCFPTSFRPVSNLPTEKASVNQLSGHMNKVRPLPLGQSAYRPFHSTETALLKVQSDILLNMDDQKVTLLVMLDLSAAFNTIDHSILLETLSSGLGVGGTALKWFTSYLSQRTQQVQIKGTLSEKKQLTTGVPQGSCLGPVLFTIYVADLFQIIEKHLPEAQGYADDHQVYLSDPFLPRIKQPQSLPLKIVWQNWGAGWFPTCLWWMTARQNSWL